MALGGIDTPLESGIVREAKPKDLEQNDKGSNPVKVKKILGLKCLLFLSFMVFLKSGIILELYKMIELVLVT